MAFIHTIPPEESEGPVREMYERQQDAWGYVPDYAKVFSARPEVLARWGRLLAEIRRPMSDRRFELVTFAAAHELRHSSCTLVHGDALAAFIGHEAVADIARGGTPDALTGAEAALVRFARKVAADASAVTGEDVDALKALGLPDEEIFDAVAAAAGRAFFTKLLDALGSVPDSTLGRIDAGFRAAVAVGRPLSEAPVERLPEADSPP
jgi:uncharacterized peroxidase-related enzyme